MTEKSQSSSRAVKIIAACYLTVMMSVWTEYRNIKLCAQVVIASSQIIQVLQKTNWTKYLRRTKKQVYLGFF
jgi:hypothetical protein